MNIVKIIIKILLGFILIISLLGFIFIHEISNTILNKEFIIQKLDENNYYENLYSNIINEMKGYIGSSGLDETILTDIISTKKVKTDVNIIIENIYEDKNEKLDILEIQNKLDSNIKDFLKHQNLKVNNKENLEEFSKKIIEEYEKGISYNTYTDYIKSISITKIKEVLEKGEIVCLIGISLTIIGYILLDLKKNKKNIFEIMIFVLSCGIIINVAIIYIKTTLKIDNITILNGAVSITMRDITKTILNNMMNIGVLLIIISLLLIILGNIIKIVYKRNHN